MREEADLDALITRIQSDLRAGRGPRHSEPVKLDERERRLRADLRAIRNRPARRRPARRREALRHLAARWLVPAAIILAVLIATLLLDRP